ncbi:hypothetical protein [Microcoleus sp. FACHB-831]|nr:hypothetical protein [Microcoleus sp. FACHB-831]
MFRINNKKRRDRNEREREINARDRAKVSGLSLPKQEWLNPA